MKYLLIASSKLITVYQDDIVFLIAKRKPKWFGRRNTRIFKNEEILLESDCTKFAFWDLVTIKWQQLTQNLEVNKIRGEVVLRVGENVLSMKKKFIGNPQFTLFKNGNKVGEVYAELFSINAYEYPFDIVFSNTDEEEQLFLLIYFIINLPALSIS